ncbi:MAG: cysteine synthase family protein [Cellulosilyticum sp.]|nr:cysteine synthase family protein [Cellulosilyticum sp.]
MLYNDMHELIGNTPIVKLNHMGIEENINVYGKLEYWNPSGSVKDRTGVYMVKDAKDRGILKEGGTIIEATAGNTGLGIAFAAMNQGYKVICVVPDKFSEEKQALMKALGATIVNTERAGGMLGAAKKAEELKTKILGAISLKQFDNPSNPQAHYETTGREIYEDLLGEIDYFVAGAGSGGTYTGIMRYLKEKNPNIKGILADPVGSTMGGGTHSDYDIEGIGNDFIAATMDMSLVDDIIKITDAEAFENARLLAANEGILVGSSSGAALAAVKKLTAKLAREQTGKRFNVVTLFPDRGDRYFSKDLYVTKK